ncbi:hypothetical protein CRENBAI_020969 [Crenichthys baileyi]|uniref:Ig-like domain-containing protein n=1 Tax=Crenichthys baileyi TaxID=28760 RepID=A0AAV9RCU0_9TELE
MCCPSVATLYYPKVVFAPGARAEKPICLGYRTLLAVRHLGAPPQKKRNSHQITFTTNMFSVALLLLLDPPGQRLTIRCQVSYSLGYYTAWIRQPAGKGMEWIGMKNTGGSYYKDSLKNKFSIDLDTSSKTVTLNGQNMQLEDSAVYYCARDPQ